MISKILVPYDLASKPSDSALAYAIKMAEMTDYTAEVTLLHVITEIPIYPVIENMTRLRKSSGQVGKTMKEHANEVYSAMRKHVDTILEDKKREYLTRNKSVGLKITTEVLLGNPVETIIDYAKNERIDMIIIGNTGRSGVSKLRNLGSVSRGVSERASCPVMIVH